MKRFLFHSLLLVCCFLFIMYWTKSNYEQYTPPLLGGLTLLYVISTMKRKWRNSALSILALTVNALLLILTTGGMNSMLFFLLYFLSFSIGFILSSESVFVFSLLIILLFLPQSIQENTLLNYTKLTSFLLLSPLAYFFGKEMHTHEKEERKLIQKEKDIELATERIISDVSEIVQNEGPALMEQDVEKLHDIIQQTKELEETKT